MATRQERMRDRMRGAGRHNVGDVDFGFVIPVAEQPTIDPDEPPVVEISPPRPAPAPVPAPTVRPSPNTSAKRKHLDRDASRSAAPRQPAVASSIPAVNAPVAEPDVYDLPDHSTEGGETTHAPSEILEQSPRRRRRRRQEEPTPAAIADAEDQEMQDAYPRPTSTRPRRGPLSSVISATKRLSIDPSSPPANAAAMRHSHAPEEVTESPADAPGSGRRRPLGLGTGTPVVGSSAILQKVVDDMDDDGSTVQLPEHSSPVERRVATRRSGELRRARMSVASTRTTRAGTRLSGSSVAETEEVSQLVTVKRSTVQSVEDRQASEGGDEQHEQEAGGEEEEEEEAEEVGEKEAAQRLGRKRPRRSLPEPSPGLGTGQSEDSPAPKRRRRKEAASPAQQQQPAKMVGAGRPPVTRQSRTQQQRRQQQTQPSPRPTRSQVQPKPKPKPKGNRTVKKKKRPRHEAADAGKEGGEEESGSVPVTVQRFTKPPRAGNGAAGAGGPDEPGSADLPFALDDDGSGEIPFANRAGVNAVDVLSKLCEELVEAYMAKLEERGRAARDAAARREQRTMYRALEAFQEELRTRLLEHTIALDTLHALRKRVRAAQKERLALRDEILRIRAEREQVALRMDAVRARHEAEAKEALRHISLSSAMHDIDLAVERGQAAPELSPREQKKAELANLELLISRVADQACTRSDGGGALKQIREFNAFLERTAAVLEGR